MTTWYKTRSHQYTIEPVEVVNETKSMLTVKDIWMGKVFERRVRKCSETINYHRTWEDARQTLLERAESKERSWSLQLAGIRHTILDLKKMKGPDK